MKVNFKRIVFFIICTELLLAYIHGIHVDSFL